MYGGVYLGLWGKLPEHDGEQTHPLICHLLDTGYVTAAIWSRLPSGSIKRALSGALGLGEEAAGKWLAFWASLHDIGKATPVFQGVAARRHSEVMLALKRADFKFGGPQRRVRHDVLGKAILDEMLADESQPGALPWDICRQVATVLGGHHGIFPLASQLRGLRWSIGSDRWAEQRKAIHSALVDHWGVSELPRPHSPSKADQAMWMVLGGLISAADWIASLEDSFPYAGSSVDLESYIAELPGKAAKALDHIGWQSWQPAGEERNFEAVFGRKPYEMQQLAEAAGRELTGPSMVLIEAPMGLGKTEAAFRLIEDFVRRFKQPGAYIALPTQATSNQMFRRFLNFLNRFVAEGTADLRLLHQQAMLSPDFQRLRPTSVGEGGDGGSPTVAAHEWFAASKRGLLAPFGVGTVDQALLSVLQTRHFFVRLFGLAGKVVVFDEVHAYDTYTSELLKQLIRWLGKLGCSVVLLSATLPRRKRRELLQAFRPEQRIGDQAPYPRISVLGKAGGRSWHVASCPRKIIHLRTVPSDQAQLASRLAEALSGGGCAACVCNTVGRAQRLYEAIRRRFSEDDCELELLHARFPARDRRRKEDRVICRFGKEGWGKQQRPGKAVVVATQVIEQSLDLDFDLMVTDHAPVDLVLQRAGRLHRHAEVDGRSTLRPPGLANPSLWIAVDVPPEGQIPTFGVDERIYEGYLLLRSYLALVRFGPERLAIPDDLERLVEQVYGEEEPWPLDENWNQALALARQELAPVERSDRFAAQVREICDPEHPDGVLDHWSQDLGEDESVAAQAGLSGLTRKALPSVRVVCLHEVEGRTCLDPEGRQPVDLDRPPDRELLLGLLDRSLSLTHQGLVHHFQKQCLPKGWRKAPILRNCRPLILLESETRIGKHTVRLDHDLGIIIAKEETISKED